MGVSERRIRQMCESGKLLGARKQGSVWQIPKTADVRLMETPDGLGTPEDFHRLPKNKQDLAIWRAGIVQQARAFIGASVRTGAARRQALAAFAKNAQVSTRSVQRWMSDYRRHGILGLVDKRGAAVKGPEISDAAWNEFLSLYLDEKRPSVRQCYDIVCFQNQQQDLNWRLPSLRRMQQLIHERVPKPALILNREGQAAYDAQCAPYIMTDLSAIEPGSVWIGDHHQFDCWVRHRGKWIRPWITAWEDMRSRAIVGWLVTDAPNSTTIMQAFRDGCETFGPPESVKIDNGKDYDSELFTGTTKQRRKLQTRLDEKNISGIYANMNISVSFSIPYHPQSKAIERWFDTLEGQFVRTMPTYCGKDTDRRPEHLFDYLKTGRALDEAMELDEFAEIVGHYIQTYNTTAHTGRGMDRATPLQVMATRDGRRMVDAASLALLCRSYDPEDMAAGRGYDAHTYHYITTAEQAQMVGYQVNESDLRESAAAKARARKTVKQYKPAAKIANTQLVHLTLAAAQSRTQETPDSGTPAMRPVATVMDGQGTVIGRLEQQRRLKRAVGAEGTTRDIELHLDRLRAEPDVPDIDLRLGQVTQPKANINLRLFEK